MHAFAFSVLVLGDICDIFPNEFKQGKMCSTKLKSSLTGSGNQANQNI